MLTTLPYIEAPAGEKPVQLASVEVDVVISGIFAETTTTMVFHNPNSRALEGSLVFPLPDGAIVSGYALDVMGQLVDGVVVAKQKARQILEAEVRKGVDPGLIEQVAGNLYRVRVYPLPPGGERTVRITYLSELAQDGRAAAYELRVPTEAELRMLVHSPVKPVSALPLSQEDQVWVIQARVNQDVLIRLPDLPEAFALTQTSPEGETFFCISLERPEFSPGSWQPAHLGVVWDASGSCRERTAELELIRSLGSIWRGVRVDLTVVSDQVEPVRTFHGWSALAEHLEQLPVDGASNLSALDLSAPCDGWLVFTDGLDTGGGQAPALPAAPVFTVTGQAVGNATWLAYLGQSINLTRTPLARALELLSAGPTIYRPLVTGGSQVHLAYSPGRVHVLGRLDEDHPTASAGGLSVDRERAHPGTLLSRAWAGQQSRALELIPDAEEQLVELGRRYGLVTPGTSLLVLETLEQYLEYDLEPPACLPEVRQQFHEHRRAQHSDEDEQRRRRLDRVADLWAERLQWWKTDFRPNWPQSEPALLLESSRGGSDDTVNPPDCEGALGAFDPFAAPVACAAAYPSAVADPFAVAEPFAAADPFAVADPFAAGPPRGAPAGAAFEVASDPFGEPACECPAPEPMERELCLRQLSADAMLELPAEGGPMGGAASSPPGDGAHAQVRVMAWNPETPYLKPLKDSREPYQAYLRQRPEYAECPAFFLDCADHLLQRGLYAEGLRVLSNLSELALDDPALMRVQAYRLLQAEQLDEAIRILEAVLKLRPDEPQSHRDLALALGDRYQARGQEEDARRAVELFYAVAQEQWDRFPEIELVALMELNRLLELAGARGLNLATLVDPRLVATLDLDLRISLAWDADLTDVDLHVHEPTGEHAFYGHRQTAIGGLVSRDFRDGYGPEEYVLRRAHPGTYKIRAHYYGSHQQQLTGACTVLATVFTNFARPNETRQLLTVRLERPSDQVPVGEITV